MRRLLYISSILLTAALLWSCEGDDQASVTADRGGKNRVSRTALQPAPPQPAPTPQPKPKPAKPQKVQQPEPEGPDTAITVHNYCDSITGGSAKSDTLRNIDVIVIHSSYYADVDSFSIRGILDEYEAYDVSAHYLIGRDGTIYRLVPENDLSYHAGKSMLPANPSRTALNANSIGIEVVNTEHNGPTEQQYEALVRLVNNIRARHPIRYIYRHSDIAPGRKTDPWQFHWQEFLERLDFENPQKE